jgi:hypothetical protein
MWLTESATFSRVFGVLPYNSKNNSKFGVAENVGLLLEQR